MSVGCNWNLGVEGNWHLYWVFTSGKPFLGNKASEAVRNSRFSKLKIIGKQIVLNPKNPEKRFLTFHVTMMVNSTQVQKWTYGLRWYTVRFWTGQVSLMKWRVLSIFKSTVWLIRNFTNVEKLSCFNKIINCQ